MNTKSEVIFRSKVYEACVLRDGSLVVTKKSQQKGTRLEGEQAAEWIEHIRTALDDCEANELCKAISCTK